jgi:hypothetical protein
MAVHLVAAAHPQPQRVVVDAGEGGRDGIVGISACAFGFGNELRQLLSKSAGDSLGDFDGWFALPTLQETDLRVMDPGCLGERLLREPLPSAVFSHHASERRGEPRWTGHRSIYRATLTSSCHGL